jgi:predicted RNA binding protein YcfA (HicA-like mRNA interferase family)
MSRLPAMTYRDVVRKLRAAGFVFDRSAKGAHEIWYNPESRRRTMVSHHPGDIPRGTLRAIIREAGFSVEEFTRLGEDRGQSAKGDTE